MNLFQKAVKMKYRFTTTRGLVNLEDLYDMPLTANDGFCLNNVALLLHENLERTVQKSFVDPAPAANKTLENKFELVKLVIEDKQKDRDAANKRAATVARNQRIKEILAKKQDQALEEMDEAELQKLLDEED